MALSIEQSRAQPGMGGAERGKERHNEPAVFEECGGNVFDTEVRTVSRRRVLKRVCQCLLSSGVNGRCPTGTGPAALKRPVAGVNKGRGWGDRRQRWGRRTSTSASTNPAPVFAMNRLFGDSKALRNVLPRPAEQPRTLHLQEFQAIRERAESGDRTQASVGIVACCHLSEFHGLCHGVNIG